MDLKEYRIRLGITREEASASTGVPLRTYSRYEASENYGNELKRNSIYELLREKYEISEEKGILNMKQIESAVQNVFLKHKDEISFCYLFGSYAKGYESETSDVDLCVATSLTGLNFVGLIEELRQALRKKVDLIRFSDLKDNMNLMQEIMKDGIKIYG